jgi:hypothetical protein
MELKNIASIINQIVDFLKENKIWDSIIWIYRELLSISNAIWKWLSNNIDISWWIKQIIVFIKFVINILLTLLDVIKKIAIWILDLFK